MPDLTWLDKYPGLRALLQSHEELLYDADGTDDEDWHPCPPVPEGTCELCSRVSPTRWCAHCQREWLEERAWADPH